jgi:cathepsin L
MQHHQKSYHHDEFLHRFGIFKANLNFIHSHNAANKSFTVAMNKFGDLTNAEFAKLYLGTRYTHTGEYNYKPSSAASSWDWRKQGAVTGVKNQGQCGSCWSFSTTGSTEGCHFLKQKSLVSLSEQNLMDCSTSYGNQGCDGGLMTQAMDYIIANKGVDTESSYPYTAQDGTCTFSKSKVGATLKSYTNVKSGDEGDLEKKVQMGPTSVAIDASHSSFQFYSSGVYNEPDCSTSQLDHGVLSIGWGTDSGSDYWIVKNSWGTDWGLNGYIWMSRNEQNQCGIATMATLPDC